MIIALAYNPRLAPERLARVRRLARTLEQRGHELTHFDSMQFDAARDASDADCAVMAGGDGTARLVIGRQSDPGALPPLAIYPTGTINLLARELDYPRDPEKFADRIEDGSQVLRTRIATLNGEPFLACASIGFDARTVAGVSERLKARIGRFAYVSALLSLVVGWPRQAITIDTGDEQFTAEALFALRGKFYAGPWTLDRGAHLGTERLRLVALKQARRRDALGLIAYAMFGARMPGSNLRFVEADQLTATSSEPVPVQADGDDAAQTPVTIVMTEKSVSFL